MITKATTCSPAKCAGAPPSCRITCGVEIIDRLLREHGTVRGDEVDLLLDLRWLVHRRENAEKALATFCSLRRSMEERHYLAFYRLRRWLENHLMATVRLRPELPDRQIEVKLDRYCLEAVRSRCVLGARTPGEPLFGSRVSFGFKEEPQATSAFKAAEAVAA